MLFNNPNGTATEEQTTDIQLELCDLQADPFLQTREEKESIFLSSYTRSSVSKL